MLTHRCAATQKAPQPGWAIRSTMLTPSANQTIYYMVSFSNSPKCATQSRPRGHHILHGDPSCNTPLRPDKLNYHVDTISQSTRSLHGFVSIPGALRINMLTQKRAATQRAPQLGWTIRTTMLTPSSNQTISYMVSISNSSKCCHPGGTTTSWGSQVHYTTPTR